jgi:hypothetical protein
MGGNGRDCRPDSCVQLTTLKFTGSPAGRQGRQVATPARDAMEPSGPAWREKRSTAGQTSRIVPLAPLNACGKIG